MSEALPSEKGRNSKAACVLLSICGAVALLVVAICLSVVTILLLEWLPIWVSCLALGGWFIFLAYGMYADCRAAEESSDE